MPNPKFSFSLKPKEAIEYLEQKGFKQSFNYDEIMHEAHHRSFTIAKVMRDDLLLYMHHSLLVAQKEGLGFKEWKKSIRPTLKSYGWWGETEVKDPRTGEVKTIHVGSRRLRTIYETNMRVSYAVGRYKKLKSLPFSKYWMYISMLLPTTRPSHADKHGTVLPRDDTWWDTNYPPNAWNCKCKVRAYSKRDLDKRGIEVAKEAPESIATKDWAYNVGDTSKVGRVEKLNIDDSMDTLPKLMPKEENRDLTGDELRQIFYSTLGIKAGESIIDKTQSVLTVDDRLFMNGAFDKTKKQNRHLFIQQFASAIDDPDEIWLEVEYEDSKRRRSYRITKKFFRFFDAGGKQAAIMAVFHYNTDRTVGSSIYNVVGKSQIDKKRSGKLIFSKGQERR
ncbi:MAG: phage head morphogenesis protein [Sulfurovum sp.]|nr:phage head morphogenesis protein [Sulfurovum sp.]